MPLDGHDFLVAQGWSGKGTGLRQGAISRPIAIAKKKNLGGLGKDRDEAFPFWDHLFSAASKSIKLNLDSDSESETENSSLSEMKRTKTGILSNRRPVAGVSAATSGSTTPDSSDGNTRLNLLSIAKRNAARTNLYAKFYRGPVLGPDDDVLSKITSPSSCDGVIGRSTLTNPTATDSDSSSPESAIKKRKRDPEDVVARQKKKERKEEKARLKEERRAKRREDRAREREAERSEKKAQKRRERETREKQEVMESLVQDECLKKKKKEKRRSKEKESLSGTTGAQALDCIPLVTIESGKIPTEESISSEKKKKRKREDGSRYP
ncbi:hypothetical protein H0H93_013421 [Arthromyces matolae]|nr:hypothetical protein H0H93_013421 [Arthromyces matolae]